MGMITEMVSIADYLETEYESELISLIPVLSSQFIIKELPL